MDILRVLSTQLQYVPPEEDMFHLSINGRNIGHALLAISNALMGDQHVAQLSIESAGIDASTLQILIPVLAVNQTLRELYLTGNNLGPSGVKALTRALLKNRSLTTLHVANTACGDEGAAWMADLLSSGSTGLRRVDLSGNGITELGFAVLFDAVKANENLVELQLRDNDIADEIRAPLTEILKARFKPFMEQLRKEEELKTMLRKSAVASSPNNPKKKFSFKQRLKMGKQPRATVGGQSSSAPDDEVEGFHTPNPRAKRGGDMKLDIDAVAATNSGGSTKSKSAPGSPKSNRVANLIAGSKPRGMSMGGPGETSDSEDEEEKPIPANVDASKVLRLHLIEAARLKPVQKNGVSDPFCHSVKTDVRGKGIRTKVKRKTLSPQWDQWFDLSFDVLSDWSFELLVQDGKIDGDKGKLGHVIVSSKDWDLSDEKGQEQWLDIVDGLGALRVGLQATPAALPSMKQIIAQRKEAAAREKEARDLANEQKAGRPRGRTMLAPPKAVAAVAVAVEKVIEKRIMTMGVGGGGGGKVFFSNVVFFFLLSLQIQAKIPTSVSVQVRVGVAETMGRRPTMEDAILVQGQLGGNVKRDLFAVFDGHGSERVAIFCAERLGEVLVKLLDVDKKAPLDALRQAFLNLSKMFVRFWLFLLKVCILRLSFFLSFFL